jgi:hypothetical protein
MFATNLVIELPVGPTVNTHQKGFEQINLLYNEKYQQMYNFFTASVESNLILNLVEESGADPANQIFIFEEKFFSNTLEDAQQFQNSSGFQELLVQLLQSHNATVTLTTENNATLNDGLDPNDGYADTYSVELVSIDIPYVMWVTQFPYSD